MNGLTKALVLRIRLKDRKGGDWPEWPEGLRVRNFPPAAAA